MLECEKTCIYPLIHRNWTSDMWDSKNHIFSTNLLLQSIRDVNLCPNFCFICHIIYIFSYLGCNTCRETNISTYFLYSFEIFIWLIWFTIVRMAWLEQADLMEEHYRSNNLIFLYISNNLRSILLYIKRDGWRLASIIWYSSSIKEKLFID